MYLKQYLHIHPSFVYPSVITFSPLVSPPVPPLPKQKNVSWVLPTQTPYLHVSSSNHLLPLGNTSGATSAEPKNVPWVVPTQTPYLDVSSTHPIFPLCYTSSATSDKPKKCALGSTYTNTLPWCVLKSSPSPPLLRLLSHLSQAKKCTLGITYTNTLPWCVIKPSHFPLSLRLLSHLCRAKNCTFGSTYINALS